MDTTPTTPVLLGTRESQPILSVRNTVAVTDLQATQLASLTLLWQFLQSHETRADRRTHRSVPHLRS